jgi:hypothetical protein
MSPELAAEIWASLGGDKTALSALDLTGPADILPSAYGVTRLATAAVGVACLAVADVSSVRSGSPLPAVVVDSIHASAAFLSERLLTPRGWQIPPLWDEIAGDYRARDGWIRVHTNYRPHREAALRVLGAASDRAAVATAIAAWDAEGLEQALVEAGGCAAVMHDAARWAAHPHGQFALAEPAIVRHSSVAAPVDELLERPPDGGRPLAGLRVLDVTRVIAGPVATRFLAAYGAQVLRIDPPHFQEVPAALPFVTAGKRCTTVDLRIEPGRQAFEHLVKGAHVVVHGLRPGALTGLGYGPETLARLNPSLIVATHDAYGWAGPWAGRRGFDSLVQMSCGIAAEGARQTGADRPVPLPAQALDHATGFLVAAAICESLAQRLRDGTVAAVRGSLAGVANLLMRLPQSLESGTQPDWPDRVFEEMATSWGPLRAVRCPGVISGIDPAWSVPAGPLGRDAPRWRTAP